MNEQFKTEYAVAAIRVSSVKQGTQGDSPDAQKEQIERYAKSHGIIIKKFFVFLESASKDQQPMQEAIDYCTNPKNDIQLFIIKSIDRFTRGGSYSYDHLKLQLESHGVSLVDIYGIINSQKVNTLESLGMSYKWSVYSPSQKSEILEAERAKDEIRDIMSRMIGASIRYARMGYWVRRAPFGFETMKVETANGRRSILVPEPTESQLIIKMFELRSRGTLDDHQIVDEINKMGYKSRIDLVRNDKDRTIVTAKKGGNELNVKGLWRYIHNPVYAGVNSEKWTQGKPIKCKFDGLVPIETFNKANRGKLVISELATGEVSIHRRKPPVHLLKKGVKNPDFPYKRIIMCPHCERPLYGSASRGKLGKYYPAYHCSKNGHNFRVPKKVFDETIANFVKSISVSPGYIDALTKAVEAEWARRQQELHKDDEHIDNRITELKLQAKMTMEKIRFLSSEIAIKYMEEDVVKIQDQISALVSEKERTTIEVPTNIEKVLSYVRYFLEHLEYLLLQQINPVARASYFGVIFDKAPTYQEILSGTQNQAVLTDINEVFSLKNYPEGNLAGVLGFEPRIS